MHFSQKVLNKRFLFSEIEEEILEYIQANKANIVSVKIVDLANHFYTYPNTITRLCRKMGYDGFSELKAALKLELEDDAEIAYEDIFKINFELSMQSVKLRLSNSFMTCQK